MSPLVAEALDERVLLSSYSFEPIDYPDARETYANGINDAGQIVGYYATWEGKVHAFLMDAEGFHSFDTNLSGAVLTVAYDINNSGQIVGMYRDSSFHQHGFLKDGDSYSEVVVPFNARDTSLIGINDTGVISGFYGDSQGSSHGFVKELSGYTKVEPPGTIETAGFKINNDGQLVGYYYPSSRVELGFRWDGAGYAVIDASPLGATLTQALGINDQGLLIGNYRDATGTERGFRLNGGAYESIEAAPLGARRTQAWDVNNGGTIAGVYVDGSGMIHGYVAHPTPASDLVGNPPTWNSDMGGVDLSYSISGADLTTATTVGLYWSSDTTFNATGADADTVAWGQRTTATALGTYQVHAGGDELGPRPEGARYLLAVVDPGNEVSETDETNNVAALGLTDLVGTSFHYTVMEDQTRVNGNRVADGPLPFNGHFDIDAQVANLGAGDAGPVVVSIFASTDATISTTDVFIGQVAIDAVGAGGTVAIHLDNLQLPQSLTWNGKIHLGMIIDADRQLS